jgi:membrane associated rhomboid family serine protease
MQLDINIILILIISAISIFAFSRPDILRKMQFNAWQIVQRKEYYRVLSYGLVHGSWIHLLINMFVLWSFGRAVL